MVRIHYSAPVEIGSPIRYIEGSCESTDTKPTENIAQGSYITESDTGDVYTFTESAKTWGKMFCLKES